MNKGLEKPLPLSSLSWVVEDDDDSARAIEFLLKRIGCETRVFKKGQEVLEALEGGEDSPDLICLDLGLPDISGKKLFPSIKRNDPQVPIVVITGTSSEQSIGELVELGIYDYLPKNAETSKFSTTFKRALEYRKLHQRLSRVTQELEYSSQFGLIGSSRGIRMVVELIKQLSQGTNNVLLTGEPGTGKKLVSRALHQASARRSGTYVHTKCAEIHREGQLRELFHEAKNGTLFLESISDLSLDMQKVLLELHQSEFQKAVIVSSSQAPLEKFVQHGLMHPEVFYHLGVAEIRIPALRVREGDIQLLVEHFLARFNAQLGKHIEISSEVHELFSQHSWPGNIRELKNTLQAALIRCEGRALQRKHLPKDFPMEQDQAFRPVKRGLSSPKELCQSPTFNSLKEREEEALHAALKKSGGNRAAAAKMLGISRSTLYRKIKKYQLEMPQEAFERYEGKRSEE